MNLKERIRKELSELEAEGNGIVHAIKKKDFDHFAFARRYQLWYTRALRVVASLAPDRLNEFVGYYEPDPKRKTIDVTTYKIRDFLGGMAPAKNQYTGEVPFDHFQLSQIGAHSQLTILQSLVSRLDDVFNDIQGRIATELQNEGLVAARQLLKISPRAAGALAGVVLEDHLQRVAHARNVKVAKKDPTIADLNDPLKAADVYDQATWRRIQYLGDLRNLCSHKKAKGPSNEQAADLIEGVAWVLGNIG